MTSIVGPTMTIDSSEEEKGNLQDKLATAMEESAVVEQENAQKEEDTNSEPKEDPRILGLMTEVPSAEEIPVTETTKIGPSTTITPVTAPTPPTTTPTAAEATPLTKAAETKQPKRK